MLRSIYFCYRCKMGSPFPLHFNDHLSTAFQECMHECLMSMYEYICMFVLNAHVRVSHTRHKCAVYIDADAVWCVVLVHVIFVSTESKEHIIIMRKWRKRLFFPALEMHLFRIHWISWSCKMWAASSYYIECTRYACMYRGFPHFRVREGTLNKIYIFSPFFCHTKSRFKPLYLVHIKQ